MAEVRATPPPRGGYSAGMRTEQIVVPAVDELRLHGYAWLPEGPEVKAVVLIAHGMAEHALRYERLAGALTGAGYAVYAYDHRGHGRTATENDGQMLGHFADRDGWRLALTDLGTMRDYAAARHPGLPLFILGHSMGSLITRAYLQNHGEGLAGAILSGTAGDPGPIRLGGLALAKAEARLRGRRTLSPTLDKLTFGAFNKPFEVDGEARTDYEWLSRDPDEVDKYVADPWCGFICTTQFYADLFEGIADVHNPKRVADVPKDLPLFLVAGSADPVGDEWKGVLKAKRQFQAAGLADVRSTLYRDARHEILNETCRDEVTADIIAWLDEHTPTAG